MIRSAMLAAVLTGAFALATTAQAQSGTAYQAGREVAAKRGVSNPDCYARVFARHARVVENVNGRRSWNAQSTPAYNNDLRRSCNVDRLALIRGEGGGARNVRPEAGVWRPPAQLVQRQPQTAGAQGGGAYQAGYRLATQRGYANRDCFARWYARKAAPMADGGYAIWSYHHDRSDLWNECRISM